ncbi:MAG: AAA family ATPase [Treponema sp.]|nr:AAA family ATPase [Treponema sp.]
MSKIKLWNFRKFGTTEPFDLKKPSIDISLKKGVNVLIGENDSGKSAIIDAIKLVLKTHAVEWIRPTEDDFYKGCKRFRIELFFHFDKALENGSSTICQEEAKNFIEWLGWENDVPFLRLFLDVHKNDKGNIIPSDIKGGVDDEGTQLDAAARDYLRVTYLKPLRDAANELTPKKGSRLSQILKGHSAFKGREDDHPLMNGFTEFNSSIKKYFDGIDADDKEIDDKKGKELKEEVDNYIKTFYDSNEFSEFNVAQGSLNSILEKLELGIKDGYNLGLGTLNILFMASELVHLNKKDWSGIRLGLIEELEAHLHPQAQMKIIESLQLNADTQFILTTHSPNIGSKIALNNLIICQGDNAFSMEPRFTKLSKGDYVFLEKFLDATKSNLFFAKGVIFVEGWSEELFLFAFARKLKKDGIISKDLTEAGVSIVNVGSRALSRYSTVFLRQQEPHMTTPIAVITDCDIREYERNNDVISKITEELQAKRSEKITSLKNKDEQCLKTFVAPRWTFEYSVLQSCLRKQLIKILKEVHPDGDWSDENCEQTLADKLLKRTLDKPEIAIRLANEFDKKDSAVNIDSNDDNLKYLIGAMEHVCN